MCYAAELAAVSRGQNAPSETVKRNTGDPGRGRPKMIMPNGNEKCTRNDNAEWDFARNVREVIKCRMGTR